MSKVMDSRFCIFLLVFLSHQLYKINCSNFRCSPKIKFTNCLASTSRENSLWNVTEESTLVISLAINRSCRNSLIEIRWILVYKDTRKIAFDLRKFHNKQVIVFNPKSLVPNDYILATRVMESSYANVQGTTQQECWIRILNDSYSIKNDYTGNDTVLQVETNTINTGWKYCSDPNMYIQYYPIAVNFEEVENFDKLVNPRLNWNAKKNKSTLYNSPPKNHHLERKGFQFGIISNLHYNRKYRFFECPDKKRTNTSTVCRNLTEITTCPNYASILSCNPSSDFNIRYSYQHVFHVHCELPQDVANYISYGVYSLGGKHPKSKGPQDILLSYTTNHRDINFRLYAGFEHKIRIVPIEYESHVRFKCSNSGQCMKSQVTFKVLSDVLREEIEDKFVELQMAREGKIGCKQCPSLLKTTSNSFDSLIDLGKISEAVQLSHMFLRDLEEITIGDLEKNKFQLSLLEKFASVKSWNWFDLELMVGLMPFFDMEGVRKEISHTKAKAALLKNMMSSLKALVLANSHPVTIQLDMENIFFRCFYRQISQLFDTDFVKPFHFEKFKVNTLPFHAGIDEKYPDYDAGFQELFDDYVRLTEDALEALSMILFSRSKTHTHKDEHLEAIERNLISKMWLERLTLDYLDTKISDIITVDIGKPTYLTPLDFDFRFIWTLLPRDTFFWENSLKNTFPYLLFSFYAENEHINKEFHQNPVIEYKVEKVRVPIRSDGLVVPENVEEWRQDVMERFIRVYRIKVDTITGFTLAIFLSNISPVKRIKLILSQTRTKPMLEDFDNPNATVVFDGVKVSEFLQISTRGYWYIGVLPFKEDIQGMEIRTKRQTRDDFNDSETFVPEEQYKSKRLRTVSVNYVFAIVGYSCLMWKSRSFQHDICEVGIGTTMEKVQCECKEVGHPMTVSVIPMSYQIYGILDIPLKLTLVAEYTIVISTLIVIFLYCLLLSLQSCRPKKMELICFLSDNVRADRYGYIVKVKTASMVNSGTTAHIGVQLYGAQSKSKRHVLNYPDPETELLQNGQSDLFFLATEKNLGNLERLEIWSDCNGSQPDWFCENIRVYDLQARHVWYFNVQKKIGLSEKYQNHFYVKPTNPKNVKIRTPWVYFGLHFGSRHTWNVLNSSQDIYWSYLERLTVMLSHILCTFSLALYFINPIAFEYQDGIVTGRYDTVAFYTKIIFGVTVLVAPANYLFTVVLRSSKKSTRFLNNHGYYPAAFRHILWFVLTFIIVNCLTYCLVYGPFVSYTTVYDWSVIVIISLLINIFICENLFLAINNYVELAYHWINKGKKDILMKFRFRDIIKNVEAQRRFLYNKTDSEGLRPFLGHLHQPLNPDNLSKRRKRHENSLSLRRTLDSMVDIWMLAFFLFLLIPFYFNGNSSEYERHLRDIFVKGQFYDVKMGINEIFTYKELYKYLNQSIINAVSPSAWYNPYTIADAGYINDITSKLIGNVNIRQERVHMVNCPEVEVARQLFNITKCVPVYNEMFLIGNATIDNKFGQNFTRNSLEYKGILANYKGEGYSVPLGKIRQNILYRVKILNDHEWLDHKTKLIVVEMLLYNANSNLFAVVKLIFEKEANHLLSSFIIKPIVLINQDDRSERLYILINIMYFALSLKIFCGTVVRMSRKRWSILIDLFSIFLILLQILNVCYLCLFFKRISNRNDFLDVLKHSERNKFLSCDHMFYIHNQIEVCLALMGFVIILLLLQCVKFLSWSRNTLTALKVSRSVYLLLLFNFFRIIFCFGIMSHVVFGSANFKFLSLLNSSVIFVLLFVKSGLNESFLDRLWLENGDIVIWIYLTSFIMLSILKTCFIIVCISSLRKTRMSRSPEIVRFSTEFYLFSALQNFMSSLISRFDLIKRMIFNERNRLRGGVSPTFVTSKSAAYRFKNLICIDENVMEQQRLIVLAYLKNTYQRISLEINNDDHELMLDIAKSLVGKENCKMYFKERVNFYPKCEVEVVPDEKLKQMAAITECLLEKKDIEHRYFSSLNEDVGANLENVPVGINTKIIEDVKINNLQKRQLKQLTCLSEILNETSNIIDTLSEGLLGSQVLDDKGYPISEHNEE